MDTTSLIALASPAAVITTAAVGALWRMMDAKFKTLSAKIDAQSQIQDERHTENIQRMTRLETLVNGNGHVVKRRGHR